MKYFACFPRQIRSPLVFCCALCLMLLSSVSAAAQTPAASDSVKKALSANDPDAVVKSLAAASAASKAPADKKYILTVLGAFEERLGQHLPAARHYAEAAWTSDERDWSLVLDSARCTMAAGDFVQADSLIKSTLLGCFDNALLARARVYAVIVQLSSAERPAALDLCRSYAANPAFAEYAPMLLFILWWTESDEGAKKTLASSWPETPEAAVAAGKISLSAVSFWYLMDRNSDSVSRFVDSIAPRSAASPIAAVATGNSSKVPDNASLAPAVKQADAASSSGAPSSIGASSAAKGIWQQTGFFRNAAYAEDLRKKLSGLGFAPIIRSETRASGTTYYSVLVPEDEQRTTAIRLKDAGFECSLVID